MAPDDKTTVVHKSFKTDDPIILYCTRLTVKLEPIEKELHETTISRNGGRMLGAPEILQLGKNFIHLIGAKRALDIGTYTGASALSWAVALPPDGEVISMDVNHENLNNIGKSVLEKRPEIAKKIKFELAPALETLGKESSKNTAQLLDKLIANDQSGKFDFAFIDADKTGYPEYYFKCMTLLRSGGVILVDNSLWQGQVATNPDKNEDTRAIVKCNEMISNDPNSNSALINIGDGLHIAFKK